MKFGIFDHLEQFGSTPLPQLYKERLEFIKLCDEGGITGYHTAEHHGSELCVAPNQEPFLAAAAAVTTKLRIGPLVRCLPLHHPLTVVEDICILDNLSDGRVDYGVGFGIIAAEHLFFGHPWQEGRARYEEALRIIIRGLRTGVVDSEGCDYYDFPAVETTMMPVQSPNPPIWYPGNPVDAGRRGMSCLVTGRVSEEARTAYLDAWRDNLGNSDRVDGPEQTPLIGNADMVAIADTTEEAYDIAVRGRLGLRRRQRAVEAMYNDKLIPEQERQDALPLRAPGREDPTKNIQDPHLKTPAPNGTFEMVRDYYVEYAEMGTSDYVAMMLETGDMSHLESMHTLELFCEHVVPAVEKISAK